jgi:hypothetical protein
MSTVGRSLSRFKPERPGAVLRTGRSWLLRARRRREQGGQALVLFTLCLILILTFASVAIDLSVLRNDRQTLVNAIDAGALAGGVFMPVDGSVAGAVTKVESVIGSTVQATYPGLPISGYTISYRCLIGITGASPPKPWIARDIPVVCDPSRALGWTGSTTLAQKEAAFQGAGSTRFSDCDPSLGDRCNVVVVEGTATTPYSFGRVVGVTSGSTGAVLSAACNGPCGQPPSAPVDLVVVTDRTASMSSGQIADARNAAKAVLGVYDPSLQRVAFGLLGPSTPTDTCSGSGGGPAVKVRAYQGNGPSYRSDLSTAGTTGGAKSIVITKPTGSSGVTADDLVIVGIVFAGGSNTTISPPTGGANAAPNDWHLIRRTNNGTSVGMATYWKLAGASEPASYTFTFGSSVRAAGGVLVFDNYDTNNPIESSTGNTGSGTGVQANGLNTTWPNGLIVSFHATSARTTFSQVSSMTEQFDVQNGTSGTPGPSIAADTDTVPSAGSTGNRTATAGASGSWAAQLISIHNPYKVTPPSSSTHRNDLAKWIPIGFTGTDTDTPATDYNQAYTDANGNLQSNTNIVSAINCYDFPGGTGTNLSTPILMAAKYLQYYGRPNVKWGILLETDGQPNDGGNGDAGAYTCAAANTAATNAKAITNAAGQGIEVFTVAFLAGADPDCPDGSGTYANHGVTKVLKDMASTDLAPSSDGEGNNDCGPAENADQDHFFCEPNSAQLETVFQAIATQFAGIRSHLVELYPPPAVTAVAPDNGTASGGTSVTIVGKYFTGATAVRFGATNAASFTVVSDTAITAISPAGPAGTTVNITVTTPGGTSPIVADDRYTFN